MWGFFQSDGTSLTLGHGNWKFYTSTGQLQSEVTSDHGALTGLSDDDHAQYLKEKASGGLASELPEHTHESASEGGTIDLGGECCEPLANGDPTDPELVFANGDVIMVGTGSGGSEGSESIPSDIYIATTGDDTTGDGSVGNPYLTLAKALSVLPNELDSDCTVHIADGTYAEAIEVRRFHTHDCLLKITGNTTTPASVAFTGTVTESDSFFGSITHGIIVEGPVVLELEGIATSATAAQGIYVRRNAYVILDRIRATGTVTRGMFVADQGIIELNGDILVSGFSGAGIQIDRGSGMYQATAGVITVTGPGTSGTGVVVTRSSHARTSTTGTGFDWTITGVLVGFNISLCSVFQHRTVTGTITIDNASKPGSSSGILNTDLSSFSTTNTVVIDNFTNAFEANSISYIEATGSRTITNCTSTSSAVQNSVIYLP